MADRLTPDQRAQLEHVESVLAAADDVPGFPNAQPLTDAQRARFEAAAERGLAARRAAMEHALHVRTARELLRALERTRGDRSEDDAPMGALVYTGTVADAAEQLEALARYEVPTNGRDQPVCIIDHHTGLRYVVLPGTGVPHNSIATVPPMAPRRRATADDFPSLGSTTLGSNDTITRRAFPIADDADDRRDP